VLSVAQTASAQPFDRMAGQTNPDTGFVCNPSGDANALATCAAIYVRNEQAALDRVVDRLFTKARASDVGPLVYLDIGYFDSFQRAQSAWSAYRDQECRLATIDSMANASRRISYLECMGNMIAARRKQLEALLTTWNNGFRVAGRNVGTGAFFPVAPE
jgi:uncharacterized protein YecT (DUF1311 family)